MRKLTESMTDYGAQVGGKENASWIEAVGFFAGWGLPLFLAASARGARPEGDSTVAGHGE